MAYLDYGIIGGGIAGLSLAINLNQRGYRVKIYSHRKTLDDENPPYASLNPKYGIETIVLNELTYKALQYALHFYPQFLPTTDFAFHGLHRLDDQSDLESRFTRILKNNPFLKNEMILEKSKSIGNHSSIFFKTAGWIRTGKLFQLNQIPLKEISIDHIENNGHQIKLYSQKQMVGEHECIILCNPQTLNRFSEREIFNEHFSGSITIGKHQSQHQSNITKDGYILFDGDNFSSGSSYYKSIYSETLDPESEKKTLQKKIGWFHDKQLICPDVNVWSGDRYTTKQRRPYVGKMLKQVNNQIEFKWYDNVFINTFYGSKGFSFAPFLSELLIDLMLNQTKNEDVKFLNYLNPYQNNIKGLSKSKLKGFYYV